MIMITSYGRSIMSATFNICSCDESTFLNVCTSFLHCTLCICNKMLQLRNKRKGINMRCRAWVRNRFCKNSTDGIFCHVHAKLPAYGSFFHMLPSTVVNHIVSFVPSAESVQNLRLCSKTLHSCVPIAGFERTKEFIYFHKFLSRPVVTLRQLRNAAQRFEILPSESQELLENIHIRITTIRGYMSISEISNFQRSFPHFIRIMPLQ